MDVPLLCNELLSSSYKVGGGDVLSFFAYTLFPNIQTGAKLDNTLRPKSHQK